MRRDEGRWPLPVTVGPHLLLLLLAGFTAAAGPAGAALAVDLGLCALAAACFAALALRPAWRTRQATAIALMAVLVTVTGVLVLRHPWFGFLTPAAYVYAFRVPDWPWRVYGVALVAVSAGIAQGHDLDPVTLAIVIAANVAPMCAFAVVAHRGELRGEERDRALEQARQANRENAALHERLLAQARDVAVREERQRMAREIHDTLAQGLTGIVSQLRAAETAGDAWRAHVATATALARESLTEARRSVHALRPEPLDTARLGEALAALAERWSARHGVPVRAATTGTVRPIGPEAEAALLRIAQEALANVARHARARMVGVTLSYLEREVAVDVRDDGEGFDPAASHGGFGLIAMRQRAEALSGSLDVESELGHGTGISARVPLEACA
ncbi:hypothetical protein Afil01_28350 [Actinorhabdospora filicis]|uniref:Oxygen sensor histidine kinase NreB n=1 Tax=Actinorhabdospora filicis TaxID=1785913 RepID=A0A9W6SL73_9ACTN|nr:sensor histidine kinase [Actinorhabdospora filicis]GLZ78028.1 hypothetical protein Afil01_28350 [Actinorhabdospora filicis]